MTTDQSEGRPAALSITDIAAYRLTDLKRSAESMLETRITKKESLEEEHQERVAGSSASQVEPLKGGQMPIRDKENSK